MKKRFNVTGMTCASCASHVSKAVNGLDNVSCEVSLLTNSMEVTYDENNYTDDDIINAVKKAGYGASIYTNTYLKGQERKITFKRIKLIISVILMLVLMYVAMFDMIGLPAPFFLRGKYILVNLYIQLILTIIVLALNFNYFTSGFKHLVALKPNMDSLIAIGSFTAFIYAFINFILIQINYSSNFEHASHLMHELYFDSSAMIVTLVSVGKLLENISKKQTTKSLDLLMDLVPDTLLKKVDDHFEEVPSSSVKVGDLIQINPYDLVPIDGVVVDGSSNLDESSITGESLFIYKGIGDKLISGTKNQEGMLVMKATKTKDDSTMSEIVKMVEEASSSKMKLERIVDRVALIFVPTVFAIAFIAMIIWLIVGYNITFALKIFISVLVISCPCALGLATPLVVMVSTLLSSRNHILVKKADVYERLNKIDTVMLDKTGTLTKGKMEIVDKHMSDDDYAILASLESFTNHPLAKVVLDGFEGQLYGVSEAKTEIGRGVSGIINNHRYYAGSKAYLNMILPNENQEMVTGTQIFLFDDKRICGYLVFKDSIKEHSKKTISLFKKNHIKTIMMTGDNKLVAKEIADSIGIDEVYSELMPADKASILEHYQNEGHHVMMIGDGINDSVALEKAFVGVAMNETNIARSSADIVLTKNDILDAYNSYLIAKKTVRNIKINLFWAFIYNIIMIPLAAGAFYAAYGLKLNPMIGALCMSLSSICVCLNALTLNLIKLERGEGVMEFKVNDMMCAKCEAHIREALQKPEITSVDVNLKKKLVKVETTLSMEEVFNLIKDAGYSPSEK